jgi:hypothetical protein
MDNQTCTGKVGRSVPDPDSSERKFLSLQDPDHLHGSGSGLFVGIRLRILPLTSKKLEGSDVTDPKHSWGEGSVL